MTIPITTDASEWIAKRQKPRTDDMTLKFEHLAKMLDTPVPRLPNLFSDDSYQSWLDCDRDI